MVEDSGAQSPPPLGPSVQEGPPPSVCQPQPLHSPQPQPGNLSDEKLTSGGEAAGRGPSVNEFL